MHSSSRPEIRRYAGGQAEALNPPRPWSAATPPGMGNLISSGLLWFLPEDFSSELLARALGSTRVALGVSYLVWVWVREARRRGRARMAMCSVHDSCFGSHTFTLCSTTRIIIQSSSSYCYTLLFACLSLSLPLLLLIHYSSG